jgi:glycosyltransferase involved in cell wall biosynthesis
MRILLFVPGGVGRDGRHAVIPAILSLIRRLATRHEMTVIALDQEPKPSEYELEGARILNLGKPSRLPVWRFLRRLQRVRGMLSGSSSSFDVIHSIFLGHTSSLAILAGRWFRAPVVVSLGGGELVAIPDIGYGGSLRWTGRQQARFALRSSGAVTVGSQYVLPLVNGQRPDALCVPLFPDLSVPLAEIRRSREGPPRLLTISSVNRVKDPPTLLQATRLVAERFPGIHLDWVGEDVLRGEMARVTVALGIAGNVTFHGFQTYDRLPDFLQRASLYVQASRYESQGVAVCEAAAAGLPLVGTRVGILAELAPEAALATPPGDPGALAEGILRVLSNPELAVRLAGNARCWAEQHTADWTAQRFEELYARLAPRPGDGRFQGAA